MTLLNAKVCLQRYVTRYLHDEERQENEGENEQVHSVLAESVRVDWRVVRHSGLVLHEWQVDIVFDEGERHFLYEINK